MIESTVFVNKIGRTARIFRSYENKNFSVYLLIILYTCMHIVRIGLASTCIYFASNILQLKDARPSYGMAEILYNFLRNYGFLSFTDVFSRLSASSFVVGVLCLVCSVILPIIFTLMMLRDEYSTLSKRRKTLLWSFFAFEIISTIVIILSGILLQQYAERALIYVIQSPIIGNLTKQFCNYSVGAYSIVNGYNVYYTNWLSSMFGGNHLNAAFYQTFLNGLVKMNVNPTMEAIWWCKVIVFFSNSSYFTYITIIYTGACFVCGLIGVIIFMLTKRR